jgi:hypothetical protein
VRRDEVKVSDKSLFGPDNSLFVTKKIPVPPRTGNGIQTSENTGEISTKNRHGGPFS